ncbi:PAP2 superfamily protein [Sodiomyces alkalinus F11]|uniref:PAP2 superfamily protein n=1 Tax=Sodiomyces alkalinus (strain CBS 110278 / VKM F-3762 / F11) TaxID=1314773 RepID=A0A3N2QAS6_SODAK|nr:PAP2 superfamily protein [Sodiomyces alkalinus F11]ROT43817.1 PAP2 superfamily protein [Sodiomyces alkalinus F11]
MTPNRGSPSREASGFLPALARFWKRSHAPDYLGFLVLLFGYILIILFVEPFHRMFVIDDLRIMYPHAEVERVSVLMNFVYALFIPLGIMIAYNTMTKASRHKHEVTYLCFAVALVTASFLTDVIKNAVGRPRPDLIARCMPQEDTPAGVLVTSDVCTETEHHRLHDGWRSFPSGHSSFAFAGLGFLSLFFAGQLHVFRHEAGGRDLSRALVCLVPLLGAALIAISRCEDYRHDVYDVCVGSLLGYTVAYWSYRRHWPRLTARDCDEPYPYPGSDTKPSWTRLRDEEEGGTSRGNIR